jgi:large repetitive protein
MPGQPVVVSFSVVGAGVTPTGIVSITGADVNCSITLSGGSGSCSVVFNTIGPKVLTATYSGDTNYLASSVTEAHAVKNASTTVINANNPDPSVPGQPTMLSFTVSGPGVTPTGWVDVTGGDSPTCHVLLSPSGTGSCPVGFTTAGPRVMTATYTGDINYAGSSGTLTHTVNKGNTITTILPELPDPSMPNGTVLVTVTVAGGGVIPTGTVAISVSGVSSSCTLTLAGGIGSCNIVFTSSGAFTITATYSGDGNYQDSIDTEPHTVL